MNHAIQLKNSKSRDSIHVTDVTSTREHEQYEMRRSQNLSVPTADQPRLPRRTRFVLFTSTGPNNANVHPRRGSYHQLAGSPKLKSGPGDRSQWVWQDHGNVGERALSLLTRWCLRTCKVQLVDLEVVLLVHRVPRTTATPVITEKLLFGHFRLETKVVKFIHHVLVCVRTWFEQNQSPVVPHQLEQRAHKQPLQRTKMALAQRRWWSALAGRRHPLPDDLTERWSA